MSAVVKAGIDQMVDNYRDGYSLEQPFYLSPDIFAHDMDRLLSRRWLLVDHVSRIPEKGDYFLFNIANESIIIIREAGDRINAFFNVCRHRGSRVCLEQQGNKRLLTCPYHAWTYDLYISLFCPAWIDTAV